MTNHISHALLASGGRASVLTHDAACRSYTTDMHFESSGSSHVNDKSLHNGSGAKYLFMKKSSHSGCLLE